MIIIAEYVISAIILVGIIWVIADTINGKAKDENNKIFSTHTPSSLKDKVIEQRNEVDDMIQSVQSIKNENVHLRESNKLNEHFKMVSEKPIVGYDKENNPIYGREKILIEELHDPFEDIHRRLAEMNEEDRIREMEKIQAFINNKRNNNNG